MCFLRQPGQWCKLFLDTAVGDFPTTTTVCWQQLTLRVCVSVCRMLPTSHFNWGNQYHEQLLNIWEERQWIIQFPFIRFSVPPHAHSYFFFWSVFLAACSTLWHNISRLVPWLKVARVLETVSTQCSPQQHKTDCKWFWLLRLKKESWYFP